MKNALLVYNGQAGESNEESHCNEIQSILKAHGFSVRLAPTKGEGDAETICKVHGPSYAFIFIFGGDGTVNECINGLAQLPVPPTIGILPGGTANDFARTLKIPFDIAEATHALLNGKAINIDVPKANNRYFINFFAVGLIADTSDNINEQMKERLGKLSYFLSAVKTTFKPQYYDYRLFHKDEVIKGEAVLILVANGDHIGSVRLPQGHTLNDGYLETYIVKEAGLPLLEAWFKAGKIDWHESEENSNLSHYQLSELRLETTPEASIDTDGENAGTTPVHITVDTALTFLVPTTHH